MEPRKKDESVKNPMGVACESDRDQPWWANGFLVSEESKYKKVVPTLVDLGKE